MNPLDRKLLRDLSSLRGQVITIALVVACGITSYITMRSAYDSLIASRDEYYAGYRFADLFVSLERAPRAIEQQLEELPGVSEVQLRVVEQVLVPMPQMTRPASGTVLGLNPGQTNRLNDIHIKRGRDLDSNHPDEVLVIEGFALAHGLSPGDSIPAVINGTLRQLRIVGIALSPEYVMTIAPGDMTYDPGSCPILWMNERALSAAFQMEGAFNSASFRVTPGTSIEGLLPEVDRVLAKYGGFGAISREKQTSNFMLNGELTQLDSMAGFVPYLFLFVAALLVNVVLSRLVQLQRGIIATLKAIGYPDRSIGLHYLKLVSLIVLAGALLGVLAGSWLGVQMMHLYTDQYFRFPDPHYTLKPSALLFSVGVSFGAAVVGAWFSVRSVAQLPPAEAMRPPAPARYRRSILEKFGIWAWLDPNTRMIWRELSRRPLRLLLSALGISLALGIVVVARSMWDSMDYLIDVQFHRSMREDLNVTFFHPLPREALGSLRELPGVYHVEGLRAVPVRYRHGYRHRDSTLQGYPEHAQLRRLLTSKSEQLAVPEQGVILTTKLAEILDIAPGQELTVEMREGDWKTHKIRVAGVIDEPFGLSGHMNEQALAKLMDDTAPINTALLVVDTDRIADIERRLKAMPKVAGVSSPRDFKRQFDEQSVAMISVFTFIMTLFASIIAVGVIYNNARVALSQRNRDLASLRVLGFTRKEIATILFGEQAVQVALSIPLGLLIGQWMSHAMMSNVDPETYRLPVMVSTRTYLYAISVALSSALLSALLLRRKLSKLDLIGVLKTRE